MYFPKISEAKNDAMKTQNPCDVCGLVVHKYKCPKCLCLYCSVACFKQHQSECKPKQNEQVTQDNRLPEVDEQLEDEEILSTAQLENLQSAEKVKESLENPHLRTLLENLNKSNDKRTFLENLMQEPIFVEFADACLSVVRPEDG